MAAPPRQLELHVHRGEETPPPSAAPADPDAPAFRLGHRRWLDGIRGIAVLIVIGAHSGLFFGGGLGVDLFFVLSGFLITTLLVEEWQNAGKISLKRFYIRRCLRLQPALFALLIVGLLYTNYYVPQEAKAFRQQSTATALYVANWTLLHRTSMTILGHMWSLAVEEQFYLLWPVLLYGMLRAGLTTRQIMWASLAGAFLSSAARLIIILMSDPGTPDRGYAISWALSSSHTRADGLLIGCATGLFATSGLIPKARWFVHTTGVGAVLSAAAFSYMVWKVPQASMLNFYGLLLAAAVMIAVILLRLLAAPSWVATWVLGSAPLVVVGRLSYGMYLYHMLLIRWVPHGPLGRRNLPDVALIYAVSFAAAVVSYFVIERPCLRLKGRFEGYKPTVVSAAEPAPAARAA